jgi:integral membrane protein (TIGR01906 family)
VSSHRVDVVVFAIAFAVLGLVTLGIVWSGDWAYAALANATGNTSTTFVSTLTDPRESPRVTIDLPRLLEWHRQWVGYVVGFAEEPQALGTFNGPEHEHMADVRSVFRGAEVAALLALGVIVFRIRRARRDARALRLVRDAAAWAAGLVTLIGVAAAVAFEPMFQLFHRVFFPQGNFLFDPATSNLVRLYPEWYWQGITAGVAASFVVGALLAAAAAQLALRRRANPYTRAA